MQLMDDLAPLPNDELRKADLLKRLQKLVLKIWPGTFYILHF